jgi:hypothetical protein
MMNKEVKKWLRFYLLDILCGMVFWGILFGLFVWIGMLIR